MANRTRNIVLRYTVGNDDPTFTQESKDKHVSRRKLIAYGYGDGGGGPQFEHLELVRREHDLDGCPRTEHRSVGEFAEEMERNAHACRYMPESCIWSCTAVR